MNDKYFDEIWTKYIFKKCDPRCRSFPGCGYFIQNKDKIIRFFNQKTTPSMPVASAVHISGSFPIAFVGQKWKK